MVAQVKFPPDCFPEEKDFMTLPWIVIKCAWKYLLQTRIYSICVEAVEEWVGINNNVWTAASVTTFPADIPGL